MGRSESSEAGGGGVEEEGRGDIVAELSGVIVVPGVLSALETDRCSRGRSGSSSTLTGTDELLDELLALSLELDGERRRTGRSGSLSRVDELFEALLVLSSELPAARRNLGRFESLLFEPEDDELEEAVVELPDEPLGFVIGLDVSSMFCDAKACSSMVPSRINSILEAR